MFGKLEFLFYAIKTICIDLIHNFLVFTLGKKNNEKGV